MTTPEGGWSTYRRHIPWYPASREQPLPLGRHVHHDSRNLAYRFRGPAAPLADVVHARSIPILDQGSIGSCTGNAEVGVLGSDPNFGALPATHAPLDEALAVAVYSGAEVIDGDGPYPPNDNGSSGPSAAKAAMQMGLISGYVHCLSLADVLQALQGGPVAIGVNWYDSFDAPDSNGLVAISAGAQVRGGHEVAVRGIDVTARLVLADNSWGASWGAHGSFTMGWDTLDRLLSEDGDGTVSVPLTAPAPVPVPPAPVPPPTPVPPAPPAAAADVTLWASTASWAGRRHVGQNAVAAAAVLAWGKAKGFPSPHA